VNGITGNVDMNKFNGDLNALLAFAGGMATTTTPPHRRRRSTAASRRR